MIAAKYEEVRPPHVDDFLDMTDNTYTRSEILEMERNVLDALQFNMAVRTPTFFLDQFLSELGCDDKMVTCMAQYLLELAFAKIECLRYTPSQLAAAALYLSLQVSQLAMRILMFAKPV